MTSVAAADDGPLTAEVARINLVVKSYPRPMAYGLWSEIPVVVLQPSHICLFDRRPGTIIASPRPELKTN